MILVTGANGKTGRAVIAALVQRGQAVRALVRRPDGVDGMTALGVAEVVAGSMGDPGFFDRAMDGVAAVYHICPNVSADEVPFGTNAIAAAERAGVRRFVYHSVLHPQVEAMPHHWDKMRVEALLFASKLAWTILQPTAYMQNLLAPWPTIAGKGVHRTAYSVDARISLVDLADVGAAAAKVLLEPGHEGAVYEISGTMPLAQTEVAEVLGEVLGRPVRAEQESFEAWHSRALAAGMAVEAADRLVLMSRYYDRHGLVGNPNVLAWLLGRAPIALAEFARAVVRSDRA